MKIELKPIDGKKSFYGKCYVFSEAGIYTLYSYGTAICEVDPYESQIRKLWDDYSATTMRHINAFMEFIGYAYRGKAWWTSLPYNVPVTI